MRPHLRIARPVSVLERSVHMYKSALGLQELGRFEDHEGFSGVMLGFPGAAYHFEFTVCMRHPVVPQPTPEDLTVLYLEAQDEWHACCAAMVAFGFVECVAFNPYWNKSGRSFRDEDGYITVLQCASWQSREQSI